MTCGGRVPCTTAYKHRSLHRKTLTTAPYNPPAASNIDVLGSSHLRILAFLRYSCSCLKKNKIISRWIRNTPVFRFFHHKNLCTAILEIVFHPPSPQGNTNSHQYQTFLTHIENETLDCRSQV